MQKIENLWRLRMLKSIFLLVGAFTLLLSLTSTQAQTLSNCRPYLCLHSSSRVEREDWRENVHTRRSEVRYRRPVVHARQSLPAHRQRRQNDCVLGHEDRPENRTITLEPTITATH